MPQFKLLFFGRLSAELLFRCGELGLGIRQGILRSYQLIFLQGHRFGRAPHVVAKNLEVCRGPGINGVRSVFAGLDGGVIGLAGTLGRFTHVQLPFEALIRANGAKTTASCPSSRSVTTDMIGRPSAFRRTSSLLM